MESTLQEILHIAKEQCQGQPHTKVVAKCVKIFEIQIKRKDSWLVRKAGRYNSLPGVVPPKAPAKLQSLKICQQSRLFKEDLQQLCRGLPGARPWHKTWQNIGIQL